MESTNNNNILGNGASSYSGSAQNLRLRKRVLAKFKMNADEACLDGKSDNANVHTSRPSNEVSFDNDELQQTQEIVKDSVMKLAQMGDALYSKCYGDEVQLATSSHLDEPMGSKVDADSDIIIPSGKPAESSYILFFQVLFPFIISGVGMVFAGLVLDAVRTWQLFKEVPETFILVPALIGLKGNLEMTLASRLSTLANLGRMDTPTERWLVISSNFALVQVQAIIVSFLASGFAMILAWIPKGQLDWSHAALLCASSLTTASVASLILSSVMVAVILLSRVLRINPDNVATPIAASLGDLTTLGVLSLFGSAFLRSHLTDSWLNLITIVLFLLVTPLLALAAKRDEGAKDVLENGWSPVICSMLISSGGGFVLEHALRRFPKVATFNPVINGVGGNLAAVQASRLATFYHQSSSPGILPYDWAVSRFYGFKRAFFSAESDSRSARVLLILVVPGHMFFIWLIRTISTDSPPSGALFTSFYLTAALLQVILLLYVCQWLVALMWKLSIDPDNAAIPYLTALGDLSGSLFLFTTFLFVSWFSKSESL